MTTIRSILCATDLSPASEAAWDEAQRLARLFDAEVVLLHVVPPVPIPIEGYFPPQMYQELVDGASREAQAGMEAWLGRMAEPRPKARARVEDGAAAQRIVDVARDEGSDLIVVGTHGRTGFGRILLGSIADRVVRVAPCPVLTVGPRAGARAAAPAGLARILYATDFSPSARAAWPWAVALAEAAGADVDFVHVTAQPVPDRHLTPELLGRMAQLLEEQGQAEAERFLEQWERSRRGPGSPPPRLSSDRVHVLIGHGVVGEQIAHWAETRSASVIVMGTHGWSGLVRWMLGSVAHQVLQLAPCPVLTVGPEGPREEPRHAS
jgi:nucleotide-binding universal stress UspA family protein